MSRRLKFIVAYHGATFSGWQSQPNENGIQDHLERAFKRISGEAVRVHGAGRTDAGVHALAQCAHVDLAKKSLVAERWLTALNGVLPPMIRVMRCGFVSNNFHARFSAKGKIYRYRIWAAPVLPPLEWGRAWHVTAPLDVDLISSAANLFVGTRDFAGFAANRGQPETSTTRTLRSVRVSHRGECIAIEFDGDGFLYKMVRLLAGSLVQCGSRKIPIAEIARQMSGDRAATRRVVAPGCGLFLVRVRY